MKGNILPGWRDVCHVVRRYEHRPRTRCDPSAPRNRKHPLSPGGRGRTPRKNRKRAQHPAPARQTPAPQTEKRLTVRRFSSSSTNTNCSLFSRISKTKVDRKNPVIPADAWRGCSVSLRVAGVCFWQGLAPEAREKQSQHCHVKCGVYMPRHQRHRRRK